MDKRRTLEKLQDLRAWEELKSGFPNKRACLSWAAKVEPLLSFNIAYKLNFSTKLQVLHRNVSSYTAEPALDEMITVLEMSIEQLRHELESEAPAHPVKLSSPMGDYVHQDRIDAMKRIPSKQFDLTKLIQFCNELNSCRRNGNLYAIIMLCRAIIDHVPPIFKLKTFNEVANNYAGSGSFKESMERLNSSSRKIADQHLHTLIRNSEVLPTITQVDFSNDLDLLLSEVVRILDV